MSASLSLDKKYRDDPFRAVNFTVDEDGFLRCPNNKKFLFLRTEPVKGNGRTEEIYQCEDCSGCPHKDKFISLIIRMATRFGSPCALLSAVFYSPS